MIASWISERIQEGTSHQGAIVVAAGVEVFFFAVPLTKVILWGALAWGVWSILKKG